MLQLSHRFISIIRWRNSIEMEWVPRMELEEKIRQCSDIGWCGSQTSNDPRMCLPIGDDYTLTIKYQNRVSSTLTIIAAQCDKLDETNENIESCACDADKSDVDETNEFSLSFPKHKLLIMYSIRSSFSHLILRRSYTKLRCCEDNTLVRLRLTQNNTFSVGLFRIHIHKHKYYEPSQNA